MSLKVKGSISIGYSQTKRTFEFDLDEVGLTDEEWLELLESEREKILDELLDNEVSNVLDAAIWVEGEK
ncbi:MAG: hypothetical protein RR959_08360 [Erysipelotrichaceae bacterium]